ncbi:carbohydrate-binding module family 18 protein [Sporormia fimetaria CBS 119925]|uniref:chitinase n=1 Tax=Sporormia fimetaria CBS 119925 TaxID=1340428 RepID=A0A6A6VC78_9PLEO|nr:carbohydrate-binding module family 18 protein [Sporormia fimetaria CBS 119925]
MHSFSLARLAPLFLAASSSARFLMYADEWHPTRPTSPEDRAGIDHVVLAFAMANNTAAFQPKVPISTIRSEYPDAKVMIAVGGWGDTIGFSQATRSESGISQFAADVAMMLENTGADGVDIDWEYPGGNGADYKQTPNSLKTYEIPAFPKLLSAIRTAIGPTKLLSIAVPGKAGDMLAFTPSTGPQIWPSVDYVNIMSYDLMNRRDTITAHHTSVNGTLTTIQAYLALGCPPEKINLGFAFYAKFFTVSPSCTASSALGCPIVEAEDALTGADTLTSGAWTFESHHMTPIDVSLLTPSYDGTCGAQKNTKCPNSCCSQYGNCGTSAEHCSGACQHAFGVGCTDPDVFGSWMVAREQGVLDEEEGGMYFLDEEEGLFWTWDTPELMRRKFMEIVRPLGLGGVMAWSLGEDSHDWSHIRTIAEELGKGNWAEGARPRPGVEEPFEEVPGYEEDSVYDEVPVFEKEPVYEDGPVYDEVPECEDEPVYEEDTDWGWLRI